MLTSSKMYNNVNDNLISGICRWIHHKIDSIQQRRQRRKQLFCISMVFVLHVIHCFSGGGVVDAYSSASRCFRNNHPSTTFLNLHPSPNPFVGTKLQRPAMITTTSTSTANNQRRWWWHGRRASTNSHNIFALTSNIPNNEETYPYTSREEGDVYDNPMRPPRPENSPQQDQQQRVASDDSKEEAPQPRNSRNDMRRMRVDNERNNHKNWKDDPFNYNDNNAMNGNGQQRPQQQRSSGRYFNQDSNDNDKYYSDNRNDYEENDNNDSDDEYYFDSSNNGNQGNNYNANSKNQLLWERCTTVNSGTVYVVLPPPDVPIPSCILHFMGGTFFGSTPTLWYRTLLEDIVYNTNAAIIVSTIPVTLLTSPLNHIDLSQQCQIQFKTAYRTILMDEYSDRDLSNVPVCGMGHSLGARLLTVLTTLQSSKPSTIPMYKSFILISFTNYGAGSGIPGLYQLTKQSKLLQQKQVISNAASIGQQQQRKQQARRRRTQRPNRRRRNYDDINDYDDDDYVDDYGNEDDDDDGDNILLELQDILRQSKLAIQNALTPSPEELEFFPTPAQLWNAIIHDQRYRVSQTLLVQFDNDPIDQSSKLAHELLRFANNNSTQNDTNSEFLNQRQANGTPMKQHQPNIDVKFARIRGTHLTPVSLLPQKQQKQSRYYDDDNNNSYYSSMNQQVGNLFQRIISNAASSTMGAANNKKKMEERQNQYIELRQTISRYITDVVLRKE